MRRGRTSETTCPPPSYCTVCVESQSAPFDTPPQRVCVYMWWCESEVNVFIKINTNINSFKLIWMILLLSFNFCLGGCKITQIQCSTADKVYFFRSDSSADYLGILCICSICLALIWAICMFCHFVAHTFIPGMNYQPGKAWNSSQKI